MGDSSAGFSSVLTPETGKIPRLGRRRICFYHQRNGKIQDPTTPMIAKATIVVLEDVGILPVEVAYGVCEDCEREYQLDAQMG